MLAEKKLRKHVSIIHAFSQMSVLQRKLLNVLLYEAFKSIDVAKNNSVAVECQIPLSTLIKSINFNSNNTKYLKEAMDQLASLKIEWNLLKDKVPSDISFLNLRILHGSPTFYCNNTVNFSFHKIFLNLINRPDIYGTIDVDLQSQFESKYSHSLYENGTRFVNLYQNKVIQLDVFRKILGVPEDKYLNMREFNRSVIQPAIEEVNDRSDFTVELQGQKVGKKICAFEISAKARKIKNINEAIPEPTHSKIKEEIFYTFGTVNKNVLGSIFLNYSEEYIFNKIAYTKKYAKKEQSGYYPIPYFISALKNDYSVKENNESKKEVLITEKKSDWDIKLEYLQSDLRYWEKRLDYFKSTSNTHQINVTTDIVATCNKKLKLHLENKSTEASQ